MNCKKTLSLFSLYRDGQLPAGIYRSLESHLLECPDCKSKWDELDKSLSILKTIKSVEPSPGFCESLEKKLQEPEIIRFPVPSWRLVAGLATACIILLLFVFKPILLNGEHTISIDEYFIVVNGYGKKDILSIQENLPTDIALRVPISEEK